MSPAQEAAARARTRAVRRDEALVGAVLADQRRRHLEELARVMHRAYDEHEARAQQAHRQLNEHLTRLDRALTVERWTPWHAHREAS